MDNKLQLPVTPYELKDGYYRFGTKVRSRKVLWARHLGDDVILPEGTTVRSIGAGEVVWAEVREGSAEKRNWGGLVVLKHDKAQISKHKVQTKHKSQNTKPEAFYSVYGHLKNLQVKKGQVVSGGQKLGEIAGALTAENGWWKIEHLHFGIYTGPWEGKILPGYKRPGEGRTKLKWWHDPKPFIAAYNRE